MKNNAYLVEWTDAAGDSRQSLVLAPSRKIANDMFAAKHGTHLNCPGEWGSICIPTGRSMIKELS